METLKILAVGAHPDDIEFLCAGTLAKYANQGHQVVMGIVCMGEKGHATIPDVDKVKEIFYYPDRLVIPDVFHDH